MVRREIKKLEMEYSSVKYECEAPCSLRSVLSGKVEDCSTLTGDVIFTAEIVADEIALSIKHIYLRLKGIEAPADILLNGAPVGSVSGEGLVSLFDVKEKTVLGTNKLSVKFSADKCTDAYRIGIFAPIEIVRFNNAIIEDVFTVQKHDESGTTLGISVSLLGASENVRAVATLISSTGQIYYAGLTGGRGTITVSDPLYWWPHGYGVQNLYKLTVNLYGDSEIEDTAEMRVGLRKIDTAKNADGSIFEVNGVEILPMGAIYVADKDPILKNGDKKLDAYITSAAMANYNTFVIPLESRRPSDQFYELCDIHGMIVVEEVDSLSDDALATLRRRSHHASLGLVDIVGAGDGFAALFEKIDECIPDLAIAEYSERQEYPSHPSIPSDKTFANTFPSRDRHLFSREVESLAGDGEIEKMLVSVSAKYPYPKDLSEFAYASRLAAADIIEKRIKEARLAKGKRGRAVFSGIGDFDVRISSSAIDSQARWKALQYAAQRFFAPVAVYADADGGAVTFSVSNSRKLDFMGSIEYRIVDSKNVTVFKSSEICEIDALEAKTVCVRDLSDYVNGHENEYFLEYYLKEGANVLAKNALLFVPEKHFRFENPHISAEISGSDKRFSMTLTAKSFARCVELELDGVDAVFSDNCFDITTQSPIKITFNVIGKSEAAAHLSEILKIRSIYDLKPGFDN